MSTIQPCRRCDYPCRVLGATQKTNAAPWPPTVRLSSTANGVCLECAVHWLIFTVDGLRWVFERDNGLLYERDVQQLVSRALAVGSPAIDPALINWPRLLRQWNMAWPNDWPLPQNQNDVERVARHL